MTNKSSTDSEAIANRIVEKYDRLTERIDDEDTAALPPLLVTPSRPLDARGVQAQRNQIAKIAKRYNVDLSELADRPVGEIPDHRGD